MRGSFYRQAQGPARFKPGDRVRTKNIHPATHTRLPRYARGQVGVVELVHGCHVFPDSVADRRGRQSAVALHRGVRRPRIVGRRRRPDREGLDRRIRAVSGAGVTHHRTIPQAGEGGRRARRATDAVPSIPRDAEGPVFREPWEAQAFAMALALHERGLFTWPEWAATLAERSSARRRQAIPTPARPTIGTGSTRSNASSRRRGSRPARRCVAIATRGTTPPTARRTAPRSSSEPEDFAD